MAATVTNYYEERVYLPLGADRDHPEARSFQVGVYYRGDGKWLVSHGGREAHEQLSQTGKWLWCPEKMNQMRWCRFDFETACRLAEEAVDRLTVNGLTWPEWQDFWAAKT